MALAEAARALWIAGRFLTRLPFPDPGSLDAPGLARAVLAYPLIGLIIGALLGALAFLAEGAGMPPGLTAALVLTAWVGVTGGLHVDGLADTADAWVGGLGDREKTLAILKDPYAGPMGVAALVVVLIGKWAALEVLLQAPGGLAVLIGIPVLARSGLILLILTTPYVRRGGMGDGVAAHLPRRPAAAVVMGSGAAVVVGMGGLGGVLLLLTLGLTLGWRRRVQSRLGGMTGDTAGALVEGLEWALLIVAAGWLGRL
jgi:adenosylcobinamide-GDP ribazoletransferase